MIYLIKKGKMNIQDYTTFGTAKLLKEAGYPQRAFASWYSADKELLRKEDGFMPIVNQDLEAPSLWDAMKWLREEKQVFIRINKCTEIESVNVGVWKTRSFSYYMATLCTLSFEKWLTRCDFYEQACDAGIASACEWLIALVTNDESNI